MKVRDVMTARVVSVRPETPLKEVAHSLAEHGISGVPVVDEYDRVLGVVSEADFLLKEQDPPQAARSSMLSWLLDRDESRRLEAKLHATTAGACMSSPPITVEAGSSVREAAALMTRHRINRLPVLEDGKLAGIVTRADLVGTFLIPDQELRDRITAEVLHDTMWLEPDEVTVGVTEGVVRLEGTVDRRSTATILERVVGQFDGVVGVDSAVTWELDDRSIAPVGDLDREPTAASITARERPRR